jgi:hypothetical protein
MSAKKINLLFTKDELRVLNSLISEDKKNILQTVDEQLGRIQVSNFGKTLNSLFYTKLSKIAKEVSGKDLSFANKIYVEYSNQYGAPNLPPHFDGDSSDLIINFQLQSNTSWDIGLDLTLYSLQDNSALVFNGNEYIHWRPHKVFNDGEYVKMIFFRFQDVKNPLDNSKLRYSLDDKVYKEVNEFRDSL